MNENGNHCAQFHTSVVAVVVVVVAAAVAVVVVELVSVESLWKELSMSIAMMIVPWIC
jgi:hypothetical protein